MEKGSQKTQAYPWICRGFLQTLDPQEIGADRDKKSLSLGGNLLSLSHRPLEKGMGMVYIACHNNVPKIGWRHKGL